MIRTIKIKLNLLNLKSIKIFFALTGFLASILVIGWIYQKMDQIAGVTLPFTQKILLHMFSYIDGEKMDWSFIFLQELSP